MGTHRIADSFGFGLIGPSISTVAVGIVIILMLSAGCVSGGITRESTPQSTPVVKPSILPTSIDQRTLETINPCVGWWCSLNGAVYQKEVGSENELENAVVTLSQASYCSPSKGQQEVITGPDGIFEFSVYVHDTDTFWIMVDLDGYTPTRKSITGFDCLYCSCPSIEIILYPSDE